MARRVLEPSPVLRMHMVFARAVSWPTPLVPVSMEDRSRQLAAMVHLWDVLQLDPSSTRRRKGAPDPQLVIALLVAAAVVSSVSSRTSAPVSFLEEASETVRRIQADLLLLSSSGEGRRSTGNFGPQPHEGALLGGSVAGLPEVPPHLRGQMMAAVHVLTRLRGDTPTIETSDQLRTYLQTDCNGLLTELTKAWQDDDERNIRN